MIHAVGRGKHALPVDGAERSLEGERAAETRRPNRRTARMSADGDRDRARSHGGGRSGGRSAGRARVIVRIARSGRTAAAERNRRRLADDDRAAAPQRVDRSRVPKRTVPPEQLAAELRRHVERLDEILDADGQAVDRRQRTAAPIPLRRRVGRFSGALAIEMLPRHHPIFDRGDLFEAAFEICARRVRSVAELRRRVVERHQPVRSRIVACQCIFLRGVRANCAL